MTERSDMWNRFTLWRFGRILFFSFNRRVTFAHLKGHQGYRALTKYDCSISWWTNTFKYHDFHDKTAKRKTHLCCYLCCYFPYSFEDVSANINQSSYDEITQELCSSKIDEPRVRQWIEIGEHDQCECL